MIKKWVKHSKGLNCPIIGNLHHREVLTLYLQYNICIKLIAQRSVYILLCANSIISIFCIVYSAYSVISQFGTARFAAVLLVEI